MESTDEEPSGFNLSRLLAALQKNWWLGLPIAVLIVAGVTFYTSQQKRIYQASATIVFDPSTPRPLGREVQSVVELGASSYWNNQEYYKTQQKIMLSRALARRVVERLALHKDSAFLDNVPANLRPPPKEVSLDAAATLLISRMNVDLVKDSRLTKLTYAEADPKRAAHVLNVLLEIYIDQNIEQVLESSRSASEWLADQTAKLKEELQDSEMSLHKYKQKNNILSVSLDDQSNMLRAEMERVHAALTDARLRREALSARNSELQGLNVENPIDLKAKELLDDPVLSQKVAEYTLALTDHDRLLQTGKGANHPEVKAAATKVALAKEHIFQQVSNIKESLNLEAKALDQEIAGLSAIYGAAKKQALDLNLLEIEYNRLRRSTQNTEKLYSLVVEKSKESDLTGMLRFNNIRVLDRAEVPTTPVSPNAPLNLALGVVVGLGFGVLVALSRELLDRTVKSPEDLTHTLKVPFLGLVPKLGNERGRGFAGRHQGKVRHELIVHDEPRSTFAEAVRALRTNILFTAPDNPHKSLLVTSAGPAEGKTMVASCLAIALAQAGHRVLIVDCDLRRPRLHNVFGEAQRSRGVTTSLLDVDSLSSAYKQTEVENLWVLPSGPIPPNPAELLHSAKFDHLLTILCDLFDKVIIDSPPLLPVTDATVLATRVDATMLVVRGSATRKDVVRQTVRTLRDVNANLIGVALNAVDLSRSGYYNYYRYYYRHESEVDTDEVTPAPRAAE